MNSSFKKSLLISLLASTLGTSFSLFPTYAMDGPPQEETRGKAVAQKKPKMVVFATIRDAADYSNVLANLAIKNLFDYVLEAEDNILVLPEGQHSIQDFDEYYTFLNYAFSIAHTDCGNRCINNFQMDKAKEHFIKAEQYSRKYLQDPVCGEHFVSQHQSVNKALNQHRLLLSSAAGRAHFGHATVLLKTNITDDQTQEALRLFDQSTNDWEQAIGYAAKCDMPSTRQKEGLFSSLLNYRHLCQQKDRHLVDGKIKKCKQEWRHDINCAPFLRLLEEQQKLDVLKAKPVATSQKMKNLQEQKINQQLLTITQTAQHTEKELNNSAPAPLNHKIIQQNQELIHRLRINPDDPALVPLLHEIEKTIRGGLMNAGHSPSLFDIYQQYEEFIGGDSLRQQLLGHIVPLLMRVDDLKGALERALILKKLEEQKFGKNSLLIRYLCASLSNMLGNLDDLHALLQEMEGTPETLESFAQEVQVLENQNKESKAAAKAQREKRIASQIKQQQTAVATLEATREVSKGEQKPQKALPRNRDDSSTFVEPPVSPAAEKAAKQQRHQGAEAQRALAKNQSPLPVEAKKEEPKTSQSIEERVAALSSEDLIDTLGDFYNFTGTAKKVCEAIKEGSWKITREEMSLFFCQGGIGCTLQESKHKKISFPETISYEGQPVLILGGALTFPRWDGAQGDGTPDTYLRNQILNALRRILVLHLKAQEASRK